MAEDVEHPGSPEVFSGPRGVYFPICIADAEHGRKEGIPWLAVTLDIGTEDAGFIPWYQMRCLN